MPFTLASIQFVPQKGKVPANLDRIAELTTQAAGSGADMCLFPESAVTGYFLEGGASEHSLSADDLTEELTMRLSHLDSPVDIAVGFYEKHGGQPFNSAAYIEIPGGGRPGRLVHVYRKFFLPTYGVFDEERFHSRGSRLGVFDSRFGRMAILICEDVWHSILATLCAVRGAEILLVPSASPARGFGEDKPNNLLRYERMLRCISEEHGMYAAVAMLVGFEGGKGFSGGSMVYDPFGHQMVQCPIGDESMVLAEIDFSQVEIARSRTPLVDDLRSAWETIKELTASAG